MLDIEPFDIHDDDRIFPDQPPPNNFSTAKY
jgi:hypothetical protein